jgi:nucleoside-diphosphate-sugar epimerase
MRVFVTGATGFLGAHVLPILLRRGHDVHCLVRDLDKVAGLEEEGAILHAGDITDAHTVRDAMQGCDAVLHMAARYEIGSRDAQGLWQANVGGTGNVLDAMQELGVPRGLYVSTVNVYGDTRGQLVGEDAIPTSKAVTDYEATKREAHYDLAQARMRDGLPLITVQPGVIYGPGDHSSFDALFRQYVQRKLPAVPQASYCFAHVEDTAHGVVLALELGELGRSYNLAGDAMSLHALLQLAAKVTGIPAPKRRIPVGVQRTLAALMSVVEHLAHVPLAYSSEALRASAGITYLADSSRARSELGWQTRPLEDGLHETLFTILNKLQIKPQ